MLTSGYGVDRGGLLGILLAEQSAEGDSIGSWSLVPGLFAVGTTLVLCARFFRSYRRVTSEGIEHHLALFYLSRYLLSHGLAESESVGVRSSGHE